MGGTFRRAWGVLSNWGVGGRKLLVDVNGNLKICDFFQRVLKLSRTFREDVPKNLEICIYSGFGGGSLSSEFIKNLVNNSVETSNLLKICMNSERNCEKDENFNKC